VTYTSRAAVRCGLGSRSRGSPLKQEIFFYCFCALLPMPRRLLLVAVVVLLALLATRALALSSEDTRTGDKPAVDKEGKGTRYTYGMEMKEDDPYHITIPMPNYGTYSQLEGGSYVWKHGDEFYIEASKLYGQGRVNGTYQFRAYHYITLWYKDTMVNITAYDSHLDPENPYLYTSFSLSWTSTGAKTVKSWSNSPTVSLSAAQGDYRYDFSSNTGAVSGSVGGGITVYSGTYILKIRSWFQLLTTTSGGGGGGVTRRICCPVTIRIAVVNSTLAANFTASITGRYWDVYNYYDVYGRPLSITLNSFYSPSYQFYACVDEKVPSYKVELYLKTLAAQGYTAGSLVDRKTMPVQTDYWLRLVSDYGEYLTGSYFLNIAIGARVIVDSSRPLYLYAVSPDGSRKPLPYTLSGRVVKSFPLLSSQRPRLEGGYVQSGGTVTWEVYEGAPAWFEFLYLKAEWGDGSLTTANPDIQLTLSTSLTVTAYYAVRKPGQQVQVREVGLGTMYLPGEGIATPWLESADWAWNGTWILNVTEPYPVKEHIVAILMNSSGGVEVLPLPNGTSLAIQLPERWRQSPPVIERGGMKIVQLNFREALPTVKVDGRELYFVALAAWDPYKPLKGRSYDTSCWLANGTTLAVYNLTYTYDFGNGTRVVFKEPVVVSTLKVTATPIYTYGDLRQGLSLKVTASWKYLPPARTGIQPSQPSSIVGVVVIGNKVYEGALIAADSTSKTFLVSITNDTWNLYAQGVTSITASAYWLSSMGTPEGPVAMQEPAQLSVVYVMPHIDAISEGSSLTATISIFDVRTDQRYSADIYLELRDNSTFAVVWRDSGLEFVPGQKTITRSIPNTKQYVLAIYAIPAPQEGKLVVPIPAVYPPRA